MMRLSVFVVVLLAVVEGKQPPNIVFIVADDLGYTDVGYHNSFMPTPNIDNLALNGVILNQSYVQPVCTPSRNAFMSGYYPFKTGLQHAVILPFQPTCLPLEKKLLPQYMKELGYATHMVGKWHLGFCNWNCTPTYRGFDTFFGFFNGAEDYYTHKVQIRKLAIGLDLFDNEKPVRTDKGKYSANLFSERAVNIVEEHNASQPLFLYLPFQSVHRPIQAPELYVQRCAKIKDERRRTFCGMVSAMDEGIGNLTDALKKKGLYDNTIIIFTTDNGGIQGDGYGAGYNYPLRGEKTTLFEGGTRGIGFVHSPLLRKSKYTTNGLIHATDWFSTIISLGGGEPPKDVDGLDQAAHIMGDTQISPRTEFIYNLDNMTQSNVPSAGIRMGDYKLILGPPGGAQGTDNWFVPPEFTQCGKRDCTQETEEHYLFNLLNKDNERDGTQETEENYLFNIKDDPEERNNLYDKMPEMVQKMKERLSVYYESMVPPLWPPWDPKCNPFRYGGVWSPGWC